MVYVNPSRLSPSLCIFQRPLQDNQSRRMITIRGKATSRTFVPTVGEFLWDSLAARARLTCSAWVHFYHFAASTFGLTAKDQLKAVPPSIRNRPGKPAVPEHPSNVQAFSSDPAIATNQTQSNFVVMIPSQVRDSSVKFRNFPPRLLAVAAALLLATEAPLKPPQFRQFHFFVTRILNCVTFTGGEKRCQADINSNTRSRSFGSRRISEVAGKYCVPFSALIFNRNRFYFALNRPVQVDSNFPDVLKLQFVANNSASIEVCAEGEAVELSTGFEPRESCPSRPRPYPPEESGVCQIEPFDCGFSRVNIQSQVIRVLFPGNGEPLRLINIADRLRLLLECINSLLKALIVQTAMRFQHDREFAFLVGVRPKSVLKRFVHNHIIQELTMIFTSKKGGN